MRYRLFLCIPLLILLVVPVLVSGHGSQPDDHTETSDEEQQEERQGLTLNQILLITVFSALLLLGAFYAIGIKDKKLLVLMALTMLAVLVADWAYLKYVYYA